MAGVKNLIKNQPNIQILGYVSEKDLLSLHSQALAFVYPSLYEGFGLSLIKSISTGVPVISSNTSSIPEVVGQAGILVNPNSVDSIFQAIEDIVTQPQLRQKLSQICLSQASKFSWTKTATQTLNIYQSLC